VDPSLFLFYRWGNTSRFDMREGYPKYIASVENLAKCDSVKDILEVEGIPSIL